MYLPPYFISLYRPCFCCLLKLFWFHFFYFIHLQEVDTLSSEDYLIILLLWRLVSGKIFSLTHLSVYLSLSLVFERDLSWGGVLYLFSLFSLSHQLSTLFLWLADIFFSPDQRLLGRFQVKQIRHVCAWEKRRGNYMSPPVMKWYALSADLGELCALRTSSKN